MKNGTYQLLKKCPTNKIKAKALKDNKFINKLYFL